MTDDEVVVRELEIFVKEQTGIMQALNAELAPVYRRIDAVISEIKATHRTVSDDEAPKQYAPRKMNHDRMQVIGYLGTSMIAETVQFCGSSRDGKPVGYFKPICKTVVRRDQNEIEHRCGMFAELDRLSETYGPTRERVRVVGAEIDGAKRAIERLIERQKISIKRLREAKQQGQLQLTMPKLTEDEI